jgi:hypothetical protein
MSSVKGVNITNMDAVPAVMASSAQVHGRIRVAYDSYEASALASGSDITIARLPAGAIVYDVTIVHDALGASSTLKVGDSSDDDRYIAATASTAANGKIIMSEDGVIGGFGYENSSATDVLITTGGASITGTIKSAVYYTVD